MRQVVESKKKTISEQYFKTKISLLCILPLICAVLSSCAMNPDTTRAQEFSGGNGSAENPYQISDLSELYLMAHMVNDELLGDYYYVLTETYISMILRIMIPGKIIRLQISGSQSV